MVPCMTVPTYCFDKDDPHDQIFRDSCALPSGCARTADIMI